ANEFNHAKETGYALVGNHANLKCADCHNPKGQPPKYKLPQLASQKCLTCHVDQHKTNLSEKFRGGGNCVRCHSQTTWKVSNFNLSITGFNLTGAHARQNCIECHKQPGRSASKLGTFRFTGLNQACA